MNLLTLYKRQLSELAYFLASVGEDRWSNRLADWAHEFDSTVSNSSTVKEHVARTKKALGGMGSIADIVITHRNGLGKSFPETELPIQNMRLASLISELYQTACAMTEF